MSKKLIYLVSFVFVLSVALTGTAKAELVGWWKLDEGSGTVANDSSGFGRHGTITEPIWEAGRFGSALKFEGSSYVDIPAEAWSTIETQATITFWAYGDPDAQPQANFIFGAFQDPPNNESRVMSAHVPWSDGNVYFDTGGTTAGGYDRISQAATPDEFEGSWQHWAMVKNADTAEQMIYLNGVLWLSGNGMTRPMTGVTKFTIGTKPSLAEGWYFGMMDDVRLYDHPLSEEEILAVLEGADARYPYALGPYPSDGTLYEDTWINLSWRAGDFAVSHDVYLGENFDDVDAGAEGTFLGNQAATNLIIGFLGFPYPDGLVPGTTYYWRIDEVNDTDPNSPWKGKVWSFWIPPYTAYEPNPSDGVKFVDPDAELNWTGGFRSKLHYVHFGDNFDDVNSAVVGLPQGTTTYTPGTLDLEKTYYWRIDEFDGVATYKGDVWSFSTIPIIAITDPSLVGWWKLDEDMGTTAVDWSGYGNHGTFVGDPQWVLGYDGAALEFDGSDARVDAPYIPLDSRSFTITMWVNPVLYTNEQVVFSQVQTNALDTSMHFRLGGPNIGTGNVPPRGVRMGFYSNDLDTAGGLIEDNTWYHITFWYDFENQNRRIYVNGVQEAEAAATPYLGTSGNTVIGSWGTSQWFRGIIDNVRIYNKALTVEEILLAMRGDPLLAWEPKPGNGSTVYIREATPLNWSPGDNASQHDVYFGTDKGAVADADASDTTGIYRGRQGVTIYTPPEVEWGGGPYYWRIDEYNTDATISKGNVCSFTVTDFLGIEDFEDYNDYPPDEIFNTWIDGWGTTTNGSTAGYPDPNFDQGEHYVETDIVHGGSQSMPLFYENNFKYSEATLTLVSARDWTEEGVGVLSLWFYGDASNAAERMYVALNGSAVVYHDNPDAALIYEWTEWTIDLQEFAAQGVNLANVNTISIGFGDKNNLQAGGSGMVFFDDIRLYRPAP